MSSIPVSVGYISHVHIAYEYLGLFGVLWVGYIIYGLTQKMSYAQLYSYFEHVSFVPSPPELESSLDTGDFNIHTATLLH